MFTILGNNTPLVTKESVAVKADKAMGIFRVAINDLEESNSDAEMLRAGNQDMIDSLTSDNSELESITEANTKIIDKIKTLLS